MATVIVPIVNLGTGKILMAKHKDPEREDWMEYVGLRVKKSETWLQAVPRIALATTRLVVTPLPTQVYYKVFGKNPVVGYVGVTHFPTDPEIVIGEPNAPLEPSEKVVLRDPYVAAQWFPLLGDKDWWPGGAPRSLTWEFTRIKLAVSAQYKTLKLVC